MDEHERTARDIMDTACLPVALAGLASVIEHDIAAAIKEAVAAERAACAKVAGEYAKQNRISCVENHRRANKLGDDPFRLGDMANSAAFELDTAMREAEAIAAAIHARKD